VFIDYASLPPMFAHNEGFDDYPGKVIDLRKGLPLPGEIE
jgi:hypothetical protein